jgi:hypothetical protein
MRYGGFTAFEERPYSPYYGNADATPLFVVLLDEYDAGPRYEAGWISSSTRAALA